MPYGPLDVGVAAESTAQMTPTTHEPTKNSESDLGPRGLIVTPGKSAVPPSQSQASTGTLTAGHVPSHGTPLPLVSIVMPVFNKGSTIVDSLESVARQTLSSWELIVWDDGSSDAATTRAFESLQRSTDDRIRTFRSANQGVVAARNAAIDVSRGRYICCLDPDDLLEPTYLEKAVLLLERNPHIAILSPWVRSFGGRDELWMTGELRGSIYLDNVAPVASVVRREVFTVVGGFSPLFHDGCEDWALWADAYAEGFRSHVLPEPLFRYRYSDRDGRDATARALRDDFQRRISQRHPSLGSRSRPDRMTSEPGDHREFLRSRSLLFERGTHRPVFVCLPWLLEVGGGDQMVRDLVRGLVADGRTVVVVTFEHPPAGAASGVEQMLALTPYVYELRHLADPADYVDVAEALLRRLDDPIILIVGAVWAYRHLAMLKGAARGRVTVIDMLFNHVGHVASNLGAGAEIGVTVVATERLRRLMVGHFDSSSRVVTIYVGVDPPAQALSSVRHVVPDRRPGYPLFGWVGRHSVEKRPSWFIHAAQLLSDGADFAMIGDGPLMEEAEAAAATGTLSYLGSVTDPLAFIAQCSAIVLTSEIEGIPLAVMESVALGVPVVATDVGGLAEFIRPGVTGLMVSPSHVGHLVSVLDGLIDEPDRLARLKASATAAGFPDEFSRTTMVARWLELLAEYEDDDR